MTSENKHKEFAKETSMGLNLNFKLNKEQQRLAVERMLAENFPTRSLLAASLIGLFTSVVMVLAQIVGICKHAPFSYTGVGVWAGAIFFIAMNLNIALIHNRTYEVYRTATIFVRFSFIPLFAIAVIHIGGKMVCGKLFQCGNSEYEWMNLILMVTGIICKISGIVGLNVVRTRISQNEMMLVAENAVQRVKAELDALKAKYDI